MHSLTDGRGVKWKSVGGKILDTPLILTLQIFIISTHILMVLTRAVLLGLCTVKIHHYLQKLIVILFCLALTFG